ncbi:MAG: multicopper oxidase domain-containing protein [Acidobacteriota bacterium]|nr:multicopper oxidase domain-containing protein [Acidobacteriota bacterium]
MNVQKSQSILFIATVLLLMPLAAQAQSNTIPCPANITGAELQKVPEIQNADGVLRGNLYTVSEQVRMTVPSAGPGSTPNCFAQWVRAYRREAPATWNPPSSQLLSPMPGPTLRARVGQMVELTFLNMIDSNKFPNADRGCDKTSVYPGTTGDKAPDCFSGSVFTNMHYHGTHTNPNSTGDNVFLQIRPSPRQPGTNDPVIAPASVQKPFAAFFAKCEQELKEYPGPKIWPRTWSDLPPETIEWVDEQQTLLGQYAPEWAKSNKKQREQGNWPQYYIGAYPYCFKLPEYRDATQTSLTTADARTPHTHGAGSAEVDEAQAPSRPLIMGQSPGTHWYHAHKHGSTTVNVMNGMTGVFVIEGQYDDDINKFYGDGFTRSDSTKVMVVQQLGSGPGLAVGLGLGPGPDFSVNGQLRPIIRMRGNSVQMWRIVNTAARAGMYFIPPTTNGLQWKQLAQDGVQFKPANYWNSTNQPFELYPGNRADLLVKAPAYVKGGTNKYDMLVYNTVDPSDRPPAKPAAGALTLVTVVVTMDATAGPGTQFIPQAQAPAFPSFLADITDAEFTGTKILKFASTAIPPGPPPASQHTIDGKKFDGELGAVVELNRAEEWKIVNETYPPATGNQISHPFHIHINPFQVTEIFDPNAVVSTSPGAGTVTTVANAGPSTVTGNGTSFTTTFRVGDFIWIVGEAPGIILSIASDTSLTVDVKTLGVSAATYTAAVPQYTIDPVDPRAGQCVLNPADPNTWKPCSTTVPVAERIWWDVFPIPSGHIFGTNVKIPGYFKMRSRFVDFAGHYVLHCHILAHEDRGMMTVVQVTPIQTPYSHH